MSRVSKMFHGKTRASDRADSSNQEGVACFNRPIQEKFIQVLLANTLGNTFYMKADQLLEEAKAVHDEMLAKDPEFYARALAFARVKGFMRTQPLFGLARLACIDGDLFEKTFPLVVRTPNDLKDFMALVGSMRKSNPTTITGHAESQGGRRIKRVAGRWLLQNLSEYWAIKYGSTRSDGYSIGDLFRALHPRAGEPLPLVDYILGKDADLTKLPQLRAFEALKKATTDKEVVEAIVLGKLPHEQASSFAGGSSAAWVAIVEQMPTFALLRNLATIERHGVMGEVRKTVVARLTNKKAIEKSMILPFRFVEAIDHVQDNAVRDALRVALELSFANVPFIDGETAVLLDCSPSMKPDFGFRNGLIRPASVFAVAAMKKAHGNGTLVLFDGMAKDFPVSMIDSVLTQADQVAKWGTPRGGTNPSAALDILIQRKQKVDNLLVITDGEQNRGPPFVDVLVEYRNKVNPKVNTFVMDVSPYGDAILPTDPQVHYIYGWGDQALRYVAMASKGWGEQVKAVEAESLDPASEGEAQS